MTEPKQGPPVSFRPWKKHSDGMESNDEWFEGFKKSEVYKPIFQNSASKFFNFLLLLYRGRNEETSIDEIKKHDGDDNE